MKETKKKAEPLVDAIINAKDRIEAIECLNTILSALHLTTNYTQLVHLKDAYDDFMKQYREISSRYTSLTVPRTYEDLHEIRVELNFLYRDITDALSFEVGKLYLYYRESKTSARGKAIKDLKEDEAFQAEFKTKSLSGIRDVIGLSDGYSEWIANQSVSYGLWQALTNTLNSIRQMIDSVSSEEKKAINIKIQDAK